MLALLRTALPPGPNTRYSAGRLFSCPVAWPDYLNAIDPLLDPKLLFTLCEAELTPLVPVYNFMVCTLGLIVFDVFLVKFIDNKVCNCKLFEFKSGRYYNNLNIGY